MEVRLLGGFEVRLASGAPLAVPTKKAQALLAYLAVHRDRSHPRDKLAALLWGERSDGEARGDLRHALRSLRKALADIGTSALRIERQHLALDPHATDVDVLTFERDVAEGTPEALERAAAVYRGDLLLGFTLNEPLFEEWLVAERERLREKALEALAQLLAQQTKAASAERAIQTAVRLLALDPLQEAVHRTLMRLYARQGRRGAALKQYQACVGALRRELGTEPEEETRRLYQELLRRPLDARPASGAADRPNVAPISPDLPAADTPLFGRKAEVARLGAILDAALQGRGGIAIVRGEAGIGKTRLVSALVGEAVSRGCRVLLGRCHESDSILPFGPWVDAMRAGGVGSDGDVLAALHPTRRAELTRLLPEADTAGLPRASDSALPLFESVTDLVQHLAARRPLLLVVEDVHWADETSLRLLAFVSRRVSAWPAVLVVTARDDELADAALARRTLEELSRAPRTSSLVLSPLSRADTGSLVAALARVGSDAPAVAQVEERVWAMSEGNPFVTMEVMRALDQQRRWEDASDSPGALTLPASVRELVERRLDRLGARSQEMVAVAAVIGRGFEFPLLRAASGIDERAAADAVEEMVRHHVLQAVGDQLDFAHDRIRDFAYGRLLPARRQVLHRAVAEALEAAGELSRLPGEQIAQLAHHALRGALREKAARYLRQAGVKATAQSALHDARTWLAAARDALEGLPDTPPILEEAFEVRLALRSVLTQLGEFKEMMTVLRDAEAVAERMRDDHRRGRACAFLTNAHFRLGELDEALLRGARALEIAERLGDVDIRIVATTFLGHTHHALGEFARAIELARANLAALPPDRVHDFFGLSMPPSVSDRCWLLMSLAQVGQYREATELVAETIRLAESTGHLYAMGSAYQHAGTLYLSLCDWEKARAQFERQIAVLRRGEIADLLILALGYRARTLAELGHASEARQEAEEVEQLLEAQAARGQAGSYGWIYHALARTWLLLGRLDEARRLAARAVHSPSRRADFIPSVQYLLGDIAAHPDQFDAEQAEAYYREVQSLSDRCGMRPFVAHCHLGLGKLYVRTGRRAESREHLARAAAMYGEMDMTLWSARVDAHLSACR
jgi:DNA-binding SARP family transcriptional activator